jgi:thiosulfate/3-mercaptopyruvate sulfurtransferase
VTELEAPIDTAAPSPLIEPGELATLLGEGSPVVVADVRWHLGGPPGLGDYEAGHVPGAQYVDLESELTGPQRAGGAGGRHPLPEREAFAMAMRRIGVDADVQVVAYDADTSMAASRLWWLLTDAGHAQVRVLNGGYAGWVAVGEPIETGPARPVAAGTFTGRPGHQPQIDGSRLAARIATGAPTGTVLDVRAAERFRGELEPVDPVAGHIPGAVNLPSTGNVDATGRFLPARELAERFAGLSSEPIVYCGSGITAAHTVLAMLAAGRHPAMIYPGSWSDWITDPRRPNATGPGA